MKNLIINIFKTLFFFDLAIVIMSLLPTLKINNTALLKLATEGMCLGLIILLTVIFVLAVEKKRVKVPAGKHKFKALFTGILTGIALPVICVAVAAVFKGFDLAGLNKISHIYFWIPAILCNALTVELLLRGYLFSLYKKHYGFIASAIITTLLYLSLNAEILKESKIYIANLLLLNILLCFLREYTGSVISTVTARFTYSLLSCFLLGSLPLSGNYPTLLKVSFTGKALITGGENGIEGGAVMLAVTALITILLLVHKYKLISLARQKVKMAQSFIRRITKRRKTA